jgi:hypothetical protein
VFESTFQELTIPKPNASKKNKQNEKKVSNLFSLDKKIINIKHEIKGAYVRYDLVT